MGLLERLAEIRELQGKDPISDPTRIQDDGVPFTPPPYVPPVPEDWIDTVEDDDVQASYVEPSPLIPRRAPQMPQAATLAPTLTQTPDLAVIDRNAAYKGRDVELSETEHKQVVRIVLGAVARTVNEQLAEVGVKRVRRRADTKSYVHPSSGDLAEAATGVMPKKRGRPKKEKA